MGILDDIISSFMEGFKEGVEDFKYIKKYNYNVEGFSWSQKIEIDDWLKHGLDVSKFAYPHFNVFQMMEIAEGLKKGLNVDIYAKPCFNKKQMYLIRLGIEKGLDVKYYCDDSYDWTQMREIKMGLEEGLDVSLYSKVEFSSDKMKQVRDDIKNGIDVKIYLNDNLNEEAQNKIREELLNPYLYDKNNDTKPQNKNEEINNYNLKINTNTNLFLDCNYKQIICELVEASYKGSELDNSLKFKYGIRKILNKKIDRVNSDIEQYIEDLKRNILYFVNLCEDITDYMILCFESSKLPVSESEWINKFLDMREKIKLPI